MSDLPYACHVCGWYGNLEPCPPLNDATCPDCGTLMYPRSGAGPSSGVIRRGGGEGPRQLSRREWLWIGGGLGALVLGIMLYRSNRGPRMGDKINIPDPLKLGDKRTTPAPCADVLTVLPELAQQQKTTVRLHPRPLPEGTPLPPEASKLGGDFLWPGKEAWPSCSQHEIPLVGILQLRQEEFPEVQFKPGTDLLQVLWCPQSHGPHAEPEAQVFWRSAVDASPALTEIPRPRLATPAEIEQHYKQEALEQDLRWLQLFETDPDYIRKLARSTGRIPHPGGDTQLPRSFLDMPLKTDSQFEAARQSARRLVKELAGKILVPRYADRELMPRACRLFPERVVEYPPDLTAEQQKRLQSLSLPKSPMHHPEMPIAIPASPIGVYHGELSVAAGTKLLGYPHGWNDQANPQCDQGHPMEHLLTIASMEWDMTNMRRWLPAEEKDLYARAWAALDGEAMGTLPCPTGLHLHDRDGVALFICRRCKDWPARSVVRQ